MLVPRVVLSKAGVACDLEATRFSLGSILLERDPDGRHWAVSTDGRRMVIVGWDGGEHPEGWGVLVPRDQAQRAARLAKPRPSKAHEFPVVIVEGDGVVTAQGSDGSTHETCTITPPEGRFPRWREIVPSAPPEGAVTVVLDAKMLAELAAAAVGIGVEALHVTIESPEHQVTMAGRAGQGIRFAAIQMPMGADKRASRDVWPVTERREPKRRRRTRRQEVA